MIKNLAIWIVIGVVVMTLFNQFAPKPEPSSEVNYSTFLQEVKQGQVTKVVIDGRKLNVTRADGKRVTVNAPNDLWMVSDLLKNNVQVIAKPEEGKSLLMNIFVSWFPMLLLIGVWISSCVRCKEGAEAARFPLGKVGPVCWRILTTPLHLPM